MGLKAKAAQIMTAGKHEEALKAGIRKRSLQESKAEDLIPVAHPCLQSGYSKPYRRLLSDRPVEPPRVLLVGRYARLGPHQLSHNLGDGRKRAPQGTVTSRTC